MGVHDGTRIGMGGALFGIGVAATLALLIYASEISRSEQGGSAWGEGWYLGFFAFSIAVALIGVYFLVAVWTGLPTGSTAIERAFQPRLVDTTAEAHVLVPPDYVVVMIGTTNAGRGDVDEALVNVLVPDFITEIDRCDERGGTGHAHHLGVASHTSEGLIPYQPNLGSIYWNGIVSFQGRTARITYFRFKMPGMRHDFPLRLRITSPELRNPIEDQFHIRVSALRP